MFELLIILFIVRLSSLVVFIKYGLIFVGCFIGILKLLCILVDEYF